MKSIPNALLEFLLSPECDSTYCADLITVELVSGFVLRITDGQMDIPYQGNTYYAAKYGGWEVTGTECSLGLLNSTADIRIVAGAEVVMPNWNVPLMQAIQLGLFDAAVITILSTFGLSYGDTSFGTVVRYSGQITDLQKTGRSEAEGTAKPYTFTLNQPMPRQVFQPGCRWTLYDQYTCTVSKAAFTYPATVGSVAGSSLVPMVAITVPSGITLEQGVVTFTSGRNTGLSMSIQAWDGTTIRLTKPFLFPIAPGDAFNAIAGCAHTIEACASFQPSTFRLNYGGTPFIPNQEASV